MIVECGLWWVVNSIAYMRVDGPTIMYCIQYSVFTIFKMPRYILTSHIVDENNNNIVSGAIFSTGSTASYRPHRAHRYGNSQ